MNFICTPNLPERGVKLAVIDSKAKNFSDALASLGVSLIFTTPCQNVDSKISTHPDMQLCHLGLNRFIAFEDVADYYQQLLVDFIDDIYCDFFNKQLEILKYPNKQGNLLYPEDCKLNSVVTSEWVISHINNNIFDNMDLKAIKVRQGYAKCSTCVVSDYAIITADRSIEKNATTNGLDVCLVTNDTIMLDGYSNGFIGGCCGKISKYKIVFFGDINTHPDSKRIISFCEKYNVECISLGIGNLQDYGSLLPILED